MSSDHVEMTGAVSVGGLVGIAHFMHMLEPILADVSYVAAIVVAALTIWQKFRKK